MRRRLVWYFARKRCLEPDDLADDTLNRVARRLEEEGGITDVQPARYCYIVAKFVFLEYFRRPEHQLAHPSSDAARQDHRSADLPDPESETRERWFDCLDRCLRQLTAADRELVLEYYRGEERVKISNRRDLAARLGVTPNALTIRACRIRNKLERCVNGCRGARERDMFRDPSSHQE